MKIAPICWKFGNYTPWSWISHSAAWFETSLLRFIKCYFSSIWSLDWIKPYHKKIIICNISSWKPHHQVFEILMDQHSGYTTFKSDWDTVSQLQVSSCKYLYEYRHGIMMTSSNGNIFRVTGPLCGEFTGPGEFPTQRPVTRSFDVFFHLRLNKRLSKQPWGWWFETLS